MPFQPGYSPLEQRMEHLEREFVRLGQSGQNANQQAQGAAGRGSVVIQATGTLTGPIPEAQVIFDDTGGHDHSAGNSTAVPLAGDLTGTNQAAVVVGIEGVPLSGAPAVGDDHKFIRYDLGLGQFVYTGAVMLAPDAVDRNLIVPTADANHALVTKNFSATLTGANPYEHRLSTGTVVAYVNPSGAVAGTSGFFGDPTAAVLGEITSYLGYTNQMTLTGQGTGFTGFGFFNETSGTQFGDIIIMGAVNRAAPVNSQAQAAFQITCTGHLDNTGTLTDCQFNIADYNAAGTALYIEGGAANDQRIGVVTSAFDGQLTVQPRSAGRKILTLRAQSGQTANQQEWQDDTAAPQLAVLANGSDFSFLATAGTMLGQTGEKVGFLGAAPVVRQTAAAAATDLATVITLANSLRTGLIADGLFA